MEYWKGEGEDNHGKEAGDCGAALHAQRLPEDSCHGWGIGYVAIPWLPRQDYKTLQDWKALFREFEKYARILAKEGLVLQYHNHKFEFEKFGIRDDQEIWRAIGEGGIDWPAVFKACKKAGTIHYIVEQDSCPITDDPFRSLAVSRQNIRAMGLG